MLIGINCFKDEQIRSMIKSLDHRGRCDITGEDNTFVFDTTRKEESSEISFDISEIISAYTPASILPNGFDKSKVDRLENRLLLDWAVFQGTPEQIRRLVIEVCRDEYSPSAQIYIEKVGLEKLADAEFLQNNCIVKDSSWDKFRKNIRNVNRFHASDINLDILREVLRSESLSLIIPAGKGVYYRARISGNVPYSVDQMGPPPEDIASPGRANSKGIPCLYLAGDIDTTFHEIRARDLDYVSVGTFSVNDEVKIVDLTRLESISPFASDSFTTDWFAVNMRILLQISNEISKPLRRSDSELDYLPAQYIADYIKSLGFDGMKYRSTLHKGGVNYAIFNFDKFICKNVKLYQIEEIAYHHIP